MDEKNAMNGSYKIHIDVHNYVDGHVDDSILIYGNRYGIIPKYVIEPLRHINGKTIVVPNDMCVDDTLEFTRNRIYGKIDDQIRNDIIDASIRIYFLIDNVRYYFEDEAYTKPFKYYVDKYIHYCDCLKCIITLCSDAGTFDIDDGFTYYFNSKEACSHNKPHVHVDIRHENEASFSIIDGSILASASKIKDRDANKIRKKILDRKEEMLEYWNMHTDGLSVDIDQVLNRRV